MDIQGTIREWLSNNDGNLMSQNISIDLNIFGHKVEVESIWHEADTGKVYAHCGCKDFEGDLDIESLSGENINKIIFSLIAK